MPPLFVDANVFLRHLLQDHAQQSPRATRFIQRLENQDLHAETSTTVMAEVVFVLERSYKRPKDAIRVGLLALMELPGLTVVGGDVVREALDIYVGRNVSYGDAINAVHMIERGIVEVVSFDRDFDRIPGLSRTEP